MKKIPTWVFLLLTSNYLMAQIDQISQGTGYLQATYYSFSEGTTLSVDHTVWDIAFSLGGQDLGIFVNEGVGSGQTPLPQVELYVTGSTDFAQVDTTGMQRIYNNEVSWSAGAFNHIASGDDPFDFGWGIYDITSHTVLGSRVFVIKLRNGTYRKLWIESLISGVYTFQYADLDGSNPTTETVDKSDFPGKTLAYYSFADREMLDLEPDSWDLLFTRYQTPLDDGTGNILDYLVTGILLNANVKAAVASGVDPENVDYENYEGLLTDTLTAIGYDWKSFDLSTFQWSVPNDRVYFIQTASDTIWKVRFLDFEGSATGVSTLEKTRQTALVSSTSSFPDFVPGFNLFPNPSTDFIRIDLQLDKLQSQNARVNIFNQWGQAVFQQNWWVQAGENQLELPLTLDPGLYYFHLQFATDQLTRSFSVVK